MAATTYSNNLQLKLIGTGREAGTWGTSTNENLHRIEGFFGRTVQIDVEQMPTGSTSADAGTSWEATWLTLNTSDSGTSQAGSEGRSAVVEVIDNGGLSANVPVLNIRGSDSSEIPARIYFIKNALTANALIVDGGTTQLTIENGNWALVLVVPSAVGGLAFANSGVYNLFDDLQIGDINQVDNINFASGAKLDFTAGSNTIEMPAANTTALEITDGTNSFFVFDSSGPSIKWNQNLVAANDRIIQVPASSTTGLIIQHTAGNQYIRLDTLNVRVVIDNDLYINDAVINSEAQATTWTVIDATTSALKLSSGTEDLITLDSSTPRVVLEQRADAPNGVKIDADEYLSWGATYGSGGYGVRDSSGDIELRSSGDTSWGVPYTTGLTSGQGVYFESTEMTLSSASTSTEAHSLTTVPRIVNAYLKCIDAGGDLGYSQNDEIQIASTVQNASSIGISVFANDTNVGYQNGSGGIPYIARRNSTVGAEAQIDYTKWRLIIRAWK